MLAGSAGPAGADAVVPAGGCYGTGAWTKGGFTKDSRTEAKGALIKIPQSDTVQWTGGVGNAAPGTEVAEREVEGAIQIQVGGQWVNVDSWGPEPGISAGEQGSHEYNVPSVLIGIKIPLRGFHKEQGTQVCEGDVVVKVEGSATSNPLTWGGVGGLAVSGGVLYYAGRPVVRRVKSS
jgi:hypothetical protein